MSLSVPRKYSNKKKAISEVIVAADKDGKSLIVGDSVIIVNRNNFTMRGTITKLVPIRTVHNEMRHLVDIRVCYFNKTPVSQNNLVRTWSDSLMKYDPETTVFV